MQTFAITKPSWATPSICDRTTLVVSTTAFDGAALARELHVGGALGRVAFQVDELQLDGRAAIVEERPPEVVVQDGAARLARGAERGVGPAPRRHQVGGVAAELLDVADLRPRQAAGRVLPVAADHARGALADVLGVDRRAAEVDVARARRPVAEANPVFGAAVVLAGTDGPVAADRQQHDGRTDAAFGEAVHQPARAARGDEGDDEDDGERALNHRRLLRPARRAR